MRKTRFPRAITMIIVLVLFSLTVFSQNRVISGVVSDQSGAPLVNATVSVKGSKTTVITDNYGAFKISVPPNATTLVVSYVGAKAKEISLEGKTNLLVSLDVTDTRLSEVVVIGYGTSKRSDVSSAISSVKTKDLKDLPVVIPI